MGSHTARPGQNRGETGAGSGESISEERDIDLTITDNSRPTTDPRRLKRRDSSRAIAEVRTATLDKLHEIEVKVGSLPPPKHDPKDE